MSEFDIPTAAVEEDVRRALAEDLGSGDVSAALLPDRARVARLTCRDDAILAGSPWFDACFRGLDADARIEWRVRDGERVAAGSVLCEVHARSRALVSAERCALNFLQTLSGTATRTRAFVDALAGTGTRILDTRKTIPGLRLAQKYAVRCGGGSNHRIGLYDAVMIKENHILACGSIGAAVERARGAFPDIPVIVEVESLEELREALSRRPDRILLDEFSLEAMREAVGLSRGICPLEASGGIDLGAIGAVAATGVDFISVGAITKHVHAVDLSLRMLP